MTEKLVIDTSDIGNIQSGDVNINILPEGHKSLIIDTIRDDVDKVVGVKKSPPPQIVIPKPVKIKAKSRAPPPPSPILKRKTTPPMESPLFGGNSAFRAELRRTVTPKGGEIDMIVDDDENEIINTDIPVDVENEEEEEEEEIPDVEEEEEEEDVSSSDDDVEEEEEEEEKEEEKKPKSSKEKTKKEEEKDEDAIKLDLIGEIQGLMAQGYLPTQSINLSMSVATLRKILEYQKKMASEAVGVQLCGVGLIHIVNLIQKIGGLVDKKYFEPGEGLLLDGIAEEVASKIHKYNPVFRHIVKNSKMNADLEKYTPALMFAMISLEIIGNVREKNKKQFSKNQKKPYEEPSKPPAQNQPRMKPVDDISIPSESDDESVNEKDKDEEDDDDIVVDLSKPSSKKQTRKKN
jgi:hypothetical protein